jgi:PAS domain S-box-containing protein
MREIFKPQFFSIRRRVVLAFGGVLAVLTGVGGITLWVEREYTQAVAGLAHSHRMLEWSERVLRLLSELCLDQSGFANEPAGARGNPTAAERRERLAAALAELRGAMKNDAEQTRRLDAIEVQFEKSRLLSPKGGEMRPQFLAEFRDSVGRATGEFQGRERESLVRYQGAAAFFGTAYTVVVIVGTGLTLVALLGAGRTILLDLAARRRAEEVLADQHNLLGSIIDTMPDHIFVKDVNGRYVMDNRAHRNFLQLSEEDSIEGKTVFDFFEPQLAALYDAGDQDVLRTGVAQRNREEPGASRSGSELWLSTTKVPLRDPSGRVLGLVCVSADITERKAAEERLTRFAAQLERSNAELQNFASVASHDLQEPLRKILAFGDRLRVKCAPQLGEAGLDYLQRMQSAASRMSVLIQDLLKLTRITSRAQPFERCDLNAVIRGVLSDLEVAIEQKAAIIELGPMPEIDGDPVQLRQLFQNLVSNALKFQRPGVAPSVSIQARRIAAAAVPGWESKSNAELCQITVRDNGIGFDPKFGEQIFVVFQRLHNRSEYEGTGIGLAVCRKITDRHGGTLVAESSEGQGAAFIVTLPVNQVANPDHE